MSSSSTTDSVPAVGVLPADTLLQNRYRIVRKLGQGGMGAVYEAVDQRLGITVALKETLSLDEKVRKQFEQEARLLASLQHPALPRVSDHFAQGDRAYLVMQFIAGVDLARIIYQQPGPFPREQVVAWADQLLDALIYLHSQHRQVIHRDIKPHNLKLTATGQIALLDFGLAKAQPAETSTTSSTSFFGYTRQYSPLEQIQATSTGPHSDIYALGATLYHLLTGVKPADALTRAAAVSNGQADPLKPANLVHHAVGSEISAILAKAMAQDPERRYRSAAEFREALRRIGRRELNRKPFQPYPAGSVLFSEVADELEMFKTLQTSGRHKRNPAFVVVFAFLALVTAGMLYGFSKWRESSVVPSYGEKALRPAFTPPSGNVTGNSRTKSASNRMPIGSKSAPAKTTDASDRRNDANKNGLPDISVADQLERLEQVKLANPNVARHAEITESKIESSRQIKIPEIRLPAAEVEEQKTTSASKPRLFDTYRPRSVSSWAERPRD